MRMQFWHRSLLTFVSFYCSQMARSIMSLICLSWWLCSFILRAFASILRRTSDEIELTTRWRRLSCADRQKQRRSFCSRLDAGSRHWNSRTWSRRLRDRCFPNNARVSSLQRYENSAIGLLRTMLPRCLHNNSNNNKIHVQMNTEFVQCFSKK